jgi:hypothetical protein
MRQGTLISWRGRVKKSRGTKPRNKSHRFFHSGVNASLVWLTTAAFWMESLHPVRRKTLRLVCIASWDRASLSQQHPVCSSRSCTCLRTGSVLASNIPGLPAQPNRWLAPFSTPRRREAIPKPFRRLIGFEPLSAGPMQGLHRGNLPVSETGNMLKPPPLATSGPKRANLAGHG